MEKPKKLLLTGGHAATTALAVMQEIKIQNKKWELYWIGTKNTIEGKQVTNFEKTLFNEYDVVNFHITAGKLQLRPKMSSITAFLKIPLGFISSLYYLLKIKPDLVLSFGGYVSFPVVAISYLLGIPSIIHEQTSAAGVANKKASWFATIIAISRNSSKKYFPEEKITKTGNPINIETFNIKPKIKPKEPGIILVTGGSRGSQVINNTVFSSLDKLLTKYQVIHLTGELDIKKAKKLKKELGKKKEKYSAYSSLMPAEMVKYINKADIIISRAGANSVSEIIAARRPAVLIPIPWSHYNEQAKNAEYAKKLGIARIIEQDDLSPDSLINEVSIVEKNYKNMVQSIVNIVNEDKDASLKIVDLIDKII